MLNEILIPVVVLGLMGLIFGAGLAIASKVFEVEQDERVPKVRAALPGANCGGCGFPGCDAMADAIVKGKAPVNGCPVGGAKTAAAIAEIMGESAGDTKKMVAHIHCQGDCEHAEKSGVLSGVETCLDAKIAGGGKKCRYGCLGYGSCVKACQFGALSMNEKGLPEVNREKCTACGRCVAVCPNQIIDLQPYDQLVHVNCRSTEAGKLIRQVCKIGCIGCKACEKICPTGAVIVTENLAAIDSDVCIQCGQCAEKCPVHAISVI